MAKKALILGGLLIAVVAVSLGLVVLFIGSGMRPL